MYLVARLEQISERIADRLDPMLVRCVRQDLRSKVFVGVFSLLLLISASAALIFATTAGAALDSDAPYGRYLFITLGWCWSFALIVVQAMATNRLVVQERNDDTWDLVELTGLPPARIVRGLLAASLTQSALYTAAMAPFLVMAYLLRGLDLLTIFAALVSVPLLGVLAACVALMLACSAPNRKSRVAGGGVVGLLMLVGWGWSSGMQFNTFDFGLSRWPRSMVEGNADAWLAFGITMTVWASAVWMCLVFAATLLTHRAGDRSSRPRFAVTVVWLAALAWLGVILLWGNGSERHRSELIAGLGFTGIQAALLCGFFTVTEDFALTPRQAQVIAGARGWRRRAMIFFGPGAARGRWFLLAFVLSALALLGIASQGDNNGWSTVLLGWYTLGYGLMMLIIGDTLARHAFGRWCTTPLHRRLVVIAVGTAWSIVPSLAVLLISENSFAYDVLRLMNPFLGVYHYAIEDQTNGLNGLGWVLTFLPVIMVVIVAMQARRMSVVTRRVLAATGDHNPRA